MSTIKIWFVCLFGRSKHVIRANELEHIELKCELFNYIYLIVLTGPQMEKLLQFYAIRHASDRMVTKQFS